MSFNKKLLELRAKKNISEEEMANSLSCTLQEFKELEAGTREPKMQEILACAKVFEVTTDFLLGNESTNSEKTKSFDPLSALAGLALPRGFSFTPGSGEEYDDFDEELAIELAEMASAIDTKRNRKDTAE